MGPAGSSSSASYNPSQAANYQPGQVVIGLDGSAYMVVRGNPAGAPGSSADYKPLTGATGPTGPTGASAAAAFFDSAKTSSYQPGQMVIGPDGTIYTINKVNPSGTPGTSSDYTPIAGPGRIARDEGSAVATYNPVDAMGYRPGQLIVSNGKLDVKALLDF